MGPGQRAVSFEIADMAVEIERIAGEQRLLSSQVSQSIQTLTTLVHEVQAEQLRSREDRAEQRSLLTSISERTQAIPISNARMLELELKVSHWRGIFFGFSILAMAVAGLAVAWITDKIDTGISDRARLEARIERLERKP